MLQLSFPDIWSGLFCLWSPLSNKYSYFNAIKTILTLLSSLCLRDLFEDLPHSYITKIFSYNFFLFFLYNFIVHIMFIHPFLCSWWIVKIDFSFSLYSEPFLQDHLQNSSCFLHGVVMPKLSYSRSPYVCPHISLSEFSLFFHWSIVLFLYLVLKFLWLLK